MSAENAWNTYKNTAAKAGWDADDAEAAFLAGFRTAEDNYYPALSAAEGERDKARQLVTELLLTIDVIKANADA